MAGPPPPPPPPGPKPALPPPPPAGTVSKTVPTPPPPPPSIPSPKSIDESLQRSHIARIKSVLRINAQSVLGLPSTSSTTDVRNKYKELSLLCHPDKVSNELKDDAKSAFAILNGAKELLLDENKRDSFMKVQNQVRERVIETKMIELSNIKLAEAEKQNLKVSEKATRVEASDIISHKQFEAWLQTALETRLIEDEWRVKQMLKEQAMQGIEEYSERQQNAQAEQMNKARVEAFESGRDERVQGWRSFNQNKRYKMVKPPATKPQGNLNRHALEQNKNKM